MKIHTVKENNQEAIIADAVEALRNKELVVYPTETLYGLGGDAFSEDAIHQVFSAKQRMLKLPLSVAVADMAMIDRVAEMTDIGRTLYEKFMPGPLTLILNKKKEVPSLLTAKMPKVGVRVPSNEITNRIIREFGPITATSANIHGIRTPETIHDIHEHLGDLVSIYIDAGPTEYGKASTVVDVSSDEAGEILIVREGCITKAEIEKALGA